MKRARKLHEKCSLLCRRLPVSAARLLPGVLLLFILAACAPGGGLDVSGLFAVPAAAVDAAEGAAGGVAGSTGGSDEAAQTGNVDFSEMAEIDSLSGLDLPAEEAPPDEGLFYRAYKVVAGDTISDIAESYGVTTDSIITFNDVTNARGLQIGTLLKIPNMNGILYKVKSGDTLSSLAGSYKISLERTVELNGIEGDQLIAGTRIFLPDARLSSFTLREINGDLFSWPLRNYITSWYGWRNDPFTGRRAFHTGIDIGAPVGTAVRAAMEGRVSSTGTSTVMGNYIIINHHSGYSTLYAHLSSIAVKRNAWVGSGTIIGRVGNTGYSTGPHLHFTVRKNGYTLNPMTLLR